MPVWKPHPTWFREAVAAALDESACDIELLLVDDGNERSPLELLDGLDDPRIRPVPIEHRGLHGARNAGIEAARGDFIRFLDSDDIALPNSTSRLLALSGPSTIVHGATEEADENLTPTGRVIACDIEGDAVEACVLRQFNTRHVSMIFPAAVVEKAGPWNPDYPLCSDWDFTLRCLEHAPVRHDPSVATRYRRHTASVTRHPDADRTARDAQHLLLERFFERNPHRRGGPFEREAWRVFHNEWAGHALDTGLHRQYLAETAALAKKDPAASLPLVKRGVGAAARSQAAEPVVSRLRPLARRARAAADRVRPQRTRKLEWGTIRSFEPFSANYGYDRGEPIDRTHIHDFFALHGADIAGRVLEVKDPGFTNRYGHDVTSVDIVDIDPGNVRASIIADLAQPGSLPAGAFDCIVVPQTLQYVEDPHAAIANLWQALAPGGVLLVTVPCVARIDPDLGAVDRWRVLPAGLRTLLESASAGATVHVEGRGNLVMALGTLLGLAAEDLDNDELHHVDSAFPIVVCGRVQRPADPS